MYILIACQALLLIARISACPLPGDGGAGDKTNT